MILSGEIILNVNAIIGLAGFVTALTVLVGVIRNWFKQTDKWDGYDKQITDMNASISDLKVEVNDSIQILRDEQYMQTRVLFAVLDGLHQLHCNGEVTKASNELNDYLNRTTHKKPEK